MKRAKHPGFKGAAAQAARAAAARGKPLRNPEAAIAAGAQKASPKARARNPRLTKVAGVGRRGKRGAGQRG